MYYINPIKWPLGFATIQQGVYVCVCWWGGGGGVQGRGVF